MRVKDEGIRISFILIIGDYYHDLSCMSVSFFRRCGDESDQEESRISILDLRCFLNGKLMEDTDSVSRFSGSVPGERNHRIFIEVLTVAVDLHGMPNSLRPLYAEDNRRHCNTEKNRDRIETTIYDKLQSRP